MEEPLPFTIVRLYNNQVQPEVILMIILKRHIF